MRLRTEDVATSELDGSTVILDLRETRYFSVEGVGSRILRLLEQDLTEQELVEILLRDNDVAKDVVTRDVAGFVEHLRAKDLLVD